MNSTIEDKKAEINNAINKVFTYINSNLNIKADLSEYYKTLGLAETNSPKKATATINYIFERKIGINKTNILEMVLKDVQNLTSRERSVLTSLQNSVNGVFEVKKIIPSSFTLYNLVNEKTYQARLLEKFSKFSNLATGNYLVCRIVSLDNEYYVYHIVDNIGYKHKVDAYRLAVLRIAQNPKVIYYDNDEKLEELKKSAESTKDKFVDILKSDFVITTNRKADELIEKINTCFETNIIPPKEEFTSLIIEPEKYTYFDIMNLNGGTDIFKSAQAGFSSHKDVYDVAILVDEKTGLNVLPFFGTFMKILETNDLTSVENGTECVKTFIQNDKIPLKALKIAYEKYSDNFISIANKVLEETLSSFDEIVVKYRKNLSQEGFSSTTTLYNSFAFRKLLEGLEMEQFEEDVSKFPKVGRNDLCPCGSGKKYKKCCGSAYNI